jgi:hypothetical protein
MPSASPLLVPETSYLQIANAAAWICPADRDQFWAAVAAELNGREIDEGDVARAIRLAFRIFYKPIEVDDEPQQLRKLTYGSNKLEARLDQLETYRQRRQRVDTR